MMGCYTRYMYITHHFSWVIPSSVTQSGSNKVNDAPTHKTHFGCFKSIDVECISQSALPWYRIRCNVMEKRKGKHALTMLSKLISMPLLHPEWLRCLNIVACLKCKHHHNLKETNITNVWFEFTHSKATTLLLLVPVSTEQALPTLPWFIHTGPHNKPHLTTTHLHQSLQVINNYMKHMTKTEHQLWKYVATYCTWCLNRWWIQRQHFSVTTPDFFPDDTKRWEMFTVEHMDGYNGRTYIHKWRHVCNS